MPKLGLLFNKKREKNIEKQEDISPSEEKTEIGRAHV